MFQTKCTENNFVSKVSGTLAKLSHVSTQFDFNNGSGSLRTMILIEWLAKPESHSLGYIIVKILPIYYVYTIVT